MDTLEKFEKITNWFAHYITDPALEFEVNQLAPQKNVANIKMVEDLLGESFPPEVLKLYQKYDGEQQGTGFGAFLIHSLVSVQEMINSLNFSKTLIKPDKPFVRYPEKSEALIQAISNKLVAEVLPNQKNWHKLEITLSPNALGGPYLYSKKNTSNKNREIPDIPDATEQAIFELTKELYELEKADYNWSDLTLVIFKDGSKDVKRTFYDFANQMGITSYPEGAIKPKYFHIKWLPIISDQGGNYIGIDLDPDKKGTKGQVIVFGRDEQQVFVVANSWEDFLDFNLQLIESEGDSIDEEIHLHDFYKTILIPDN